MLLLFSGGGTVVVTAGVVAAIAVVVAVACWCLRSPATCADLPGAGSNVAGGRTVLVQVNRGPSDLPERANRCGNSEAP